MKMSIYHFTHVTLSQLLMERNQATLCRLEEHMKKKGIRLSDLFASLDESGDSMLTPDELAVGFATIADPSKRGRLNAPVLSSDSNPDLSKTAPSREPKPPTSVSLKVRVLDADQSLLHNREALRLSSPPKSPPKGDRSRPSLQLEAKFLDITDDEIGQLTFQISRLLNFPVKYDHLMITLNKIPQIKEVLDHLSQCREKLRLDIDAKVREAEAGSVQMSEGELVKIVQFLDPNNDGEVDLDELVSAFRLVRRGRAGIKRREAILKALTSKKAVTREELLAAKGAKILEEQARAAAEKKSKEDAIVAKKMAQKGKMVSKKDLMIQQMQKDGREKRELKMKGKEWAQKQEEARKEAESQRQLELGNKQEEEVRRPVFSVSSPARRL